MTIWQPFFHACSLSIWLYRQGSHRAAAHGDMANSFLYKRSQHFAVSSRMRAYLDNCLQTPRRMTIWQLHCRGPCPGCTVEGVRRPPLSRAQGPQRGAHGATALRGREGEGRCRPPAANLGPAGHARAPGQGPAARGSPAGVSRPIRSLPLHAQRGAHGATAVRGRGWEGRCRPAAASSEAQVPAPRASTAACKGRYDTVSEPGLLCSTAARKGRYDTQTRI